MGSCSPYLAALGAVLGPSRVVLGVSGTVLGPSWAVLDRSWVPLGPFWGVRKPKKRNLENPSKAYGRSMVLPLGAFLRGLLKASWGLWGGFTLEKASPPKYGAGDVSSPAEGRRRQVRGRPLAGRRPADAVRRGARVALPRVGGRSKSARMSLVGGYPPDLAAPLSRRVPPGASEPRNSRWNENDRRSQETTESYRTPPNATENDRKQPGMTDNDRKPLKTTENHRK